METSSEVEEEDDDDLFGFMIEDSKERKANIVRVRKTIKFKKNLRSNKAISIGQCSSLSFGTLIV